jgi:hypothetical protein
MDDDIRSTQCDRCIQWAVARLDIDGAPSPLFFCGHHVRALVKDDLDLEFQITYATTTV